MKTYIALMLTLIFLALSSIGYLYYKNTMLNTEMKKQQVTQEAMSKELEKNTNNDNKIAVKEMVDIKTGNITGKLCYPSEGIPALEITAQNINTKEITKINSLQNQNTYEFKELTEGAYYVYASILDDEKKELVGGYTKMVPCGLKYECEDHSLIVVVVEDNKTTEEADICDWYGFKLP